MADLSNELTKIQTAVKGEDMRSAIYDAIFKINAQVNTVTASLEDIQDAMIDLDKLSLVYVAENDMIYPMYDGVRGPNGLRVTEFR